MTAERAQARAVRDYRSFDRRFAALLMPVGPVAVSVIRFLIPGAPAGKEVAENPVAQHVIVWCGVIALFTLLPGAWAALQLVGRYSPTLSRVTGAFLVPGYLALGVLLGMDVALLAATEIGLPPAEVTALGEQLIRLPSQDLILSIFIVGHIVGVVLLGVVSLRARVMPRFAAIALVVSQPLHLVAVITDSRWLDLLAWNLTALGMAFLALRLLRTPNDDWELPPRGRMMSA